jgi:hypothetical protein
VVLEGPRPSWATRHSAAKVSGADRYHHEPKRGARPSERAAADPDARRSRGVRCAETTPVRAAYLRASQDDGGQQDLGRPITQWLRRTL